MSSFGIARPGADEVDDAGRAAPAVCRRGRSRACRGPCSARSSSTTVRVLRARRRLEILADLPASAGQRPLVEIAIVRSPRRTIAGVMKSQRSGWSIAFSQMPSARASTRTARFTAGVGRRRVGQPETAQGRPLGTGAACSVRRPASAQRRDQRRVTSGLTTVTRAPGVEQRLDLALGHRSRRRRRRPAAR